MRKSISFGGMRVNFSKSGVGFSTGVKGFRIGTGPRGNYIHIGSNGLYYRKTLNCNNSNNVLKQLSRENNEINYIFEDITNSDAQHLTDSSHKELLEEIIEKNKKVSFTILWVMAAIILFFINPWCIFLLVFLPIPITFDKWRKTVILIYDIEKEKEEKLQLFYTAFDDIINSTSKWYIPSQADLYTLQDRKVNAGASHLVKRSVISFKTGCPPYFQTNITIPMCVIGKQILYFLPDKVLVYQGKQVGCIDYEKLNVSYNNTRFAEDRNVPEDTRIVGMTWKYVNKNGGPDRRFKNNKQLPIVEYSEINFYSASGLNIILHLSTPDLGEKIVSSLNALTAD
jgi:hypothetical protein